MDIVLPLYVLFLFPILFIFLECKLTLDSLRVPSLSVPSRCFFLSFTFSAHTSISWSFQQTVTHKMFGTSVYVLPVLKAAGRSSG